MRKYSHTDEEWIQLNRNLRHAEIAKHLDRSVRSIQAKMARLGLTGARNCFPVGDGHPKWKGGRYKNHQGYILVKIGKGTYALEHRLVWERHNGSPLPTGYVVHHLNGVKSDNRPENLVAIPRKKHSTWTLVQLAQKRIRELEGK